MIVAVLKGQYAMPPRCSSCPIFKPGRTHYEGGKEVMYEHARCPAHGITFGKEDEEFLYKGRKRPNWCPLMEMEGLDAAD